jgi:DNA-binding FrmR family transcriptional regulator
MAPLDHSREKLVNRIKRIRGQLNAVEKSLLETEDWTPVLQTLAACRGAMNGLMAEIFEGHIRQHIVDPSRRPGTAQAEAAQALIDALRAYLT